MAVTLVHGLSCAITALWELAGVEVNILYLLLTESRLLFLPMHLIYSSNGYDVDVVKWISDVSTRTTMVHWCQVYLVLLGITVSHWVSLPAPALTDSHHGQMTPIIMLQSHDSQQITRTLSMEIEYR